MWASLTRKYGPELGPDGGPVALAPAVNSLDMAGSGFPPQYGAPFAAPREQDIQRHRLRAFYKRYCPEKLVPAMNPPAGSPAFRGAPSASMTQSHGSDANVDKAIQKYADGANGGYETMWKILTEKYGPEPPPDGVLLGMLAAFRQTAVPSRTLSPQQPTWGGPADNDELEDTKREQRERLRRFYEHYNVDRTDTDVDIAIEAFARSQGGFTRMWKHLREQYGPEPPPPLAIAHRMGTGALVSDRHVIRAIPGGPASEEQQAHHRARLSAFYSHYCPEKTLDDIQDAVSRYAVSPGGFAEMWRQLEAKYGPELTPSSTAAGAIPLSQKDRLRRFYRKYAPEKTESDINRALAMYATLANGFDVMWATLEKKYGAEEPLPGATDTIIVPRALLDAHIHRVSDLSGAAGGMLSSREQYQQHAERSARDGDGFGVTGVTVPDFPGDDGGDLDDWMNRLVEEAHEASLQATSCRLLISVVLRLGGTNVAHYQRATAPQQRAFEDAVVEQVALNMSLSNQDIVFNRIDQQPLYVPSQAADVHASFKSDRGGEDDDEDDIGAGSSSGRQLPTNRSQSAENGTLSTRARSEWSLASRSRPPAAMTHVATPLLVGGTGGNGPAVGTSNIVVHIDIPCANAAVEADMLRVAEELVRRVQHGRFSVGKIREAYRVQLGGNPVQLFVCGARATGTSFGSDGSVGVQELRKSTGPRWLPPPAPVRAQTDDPTEHMASFEDRYRNVQQRRAPLL